MSKDKKKKHGLTLTHPTPKSFLPRCRCGEWTGVTTGNRRHAEGQYRDHVGSTEAAERAAKRRGGAKPAPQQPTPTAALPDGLA